MKSYSDVEDVEYDESECELNLRVLSGVCRSRSEDRAFRWLVRELIRLYGVEDRGRGKSAGRVLGRGGFHGKKSKLKG